MYKHVVAPRAIIILLRIVLWNAELNTQLCLIWSIRIGTPLAFADGERGWNNGSWLFLRKQSGWPRMEKLKELSSWYAFANNIEKHRVPFLGRWWQSRSRKSWPSLSCGKWNDQSGFLLSPRRLDFKLIVIRNAHDNGIFVFCLLQIFLCV